MSIRRIESAYATFQGDKRLSSTDMSVLVALAYIANEEKGEACYPSVAYLAELSHFSESAVTKACANLKKLKVIDWVSGGQSRLGGNVSNTYEFLFPHRKMKSRHESYQQLMTSPSAKGSDSSCPGGGPLPHVAGYPTPRGGVPYPAWRGVTRKEHRIEHRNRTRKAEEGTTRPISSLSLSIISAGD
mgnify:CR=1 FL=1